MKGKKRILTCAAAAAVIIFSHTLWVQAAWLPEAYCGAHFLAERSEQEYQDAETEPADSLTLYAQSAVLLDGDTGRVLYGKEEELVRPMASTTKIMTCILALENGDLASQVTVSSYAASQPKVHLGAPAGRKFMMKDLLYSLMLESHNDSAVMLAEHIAGDVSSFAAMMNQKARDIGCSDTWFITPNGLDASETMEDGSVKIHSTTALDLAKIMRYCVWQSPKRQEFLEITQTQNYYFTDLEGKGSYSCVNHNAFLTMMSGVLSGKTGFTGGAGYSYVAALEDDGRKYVAVLLGCGWPPHKTYKWSDVKQLFTYGKEYYHYETVQQNMELPQLEVKNGVPRDKDLGHKAVTELTLGEERQEKHVLMREGESVKIHLKIPKLAPAPVEKNSVVGEVVYELDGQVIFTEPVYTLQDVDAVSLSWCLCNLLTHFLQ